MMNKYRRTNVEGLVEDPVSGAILNINNGALEAYKRQKAVLENSKESQKRIDKIEDDIDDIKQMLQQLLMKRQQE
jgi:uncharacterized protein Yka (UPF0111/DUF47 family)